MKIYVNLTFKGKLFECISRSICFKCFAEINSYIYMLYNLIVRRTFHNIALLFYISAFFQIYFFFFFFRPRMQILNSYEAKSIYNNLRCLPNGWTRNGSKVFWKYYYYPEYPSLQDIFEDNGYIIVILSTFLIQTHQYQLERMKFLSISYR